MACCQPLANEIEVQIDPAMYLGSSENIDPKATNLTSKAEEFDHHFICRICQMVVIDAEECSKCQNCFCSKCIKHWQKTSTNYKLEDPPSTSLVSEHGERNLVVCCPICKEAYTGTPLHRYLKNKLSLFLFKCNRCKNED